MKRKGFVMVKNIIIFLLLSVSTVKAWSGGLMDDVTTEVRLGYNIGGTMPLGMPASIRGLNKYTLKANPTIGADASKPLGEKWGLMVGLRFENKGMKTDAEVKNYSMEMRQGGETLSGRFTGGVVTDVDQWMLTVPIRATLNVARNVRLRLGPYVSYALSSSFEGYAYNGYLRVGDPTGEKVEMGNDEASRGDYDFGGDMRKWQLGVEAGADWHFSDRLGAFANLAWGLTGAFKSDFETIEQTMYPIFGTIGITYRIN